jgi:hypothetical protein
MRGHFNSFVKDCFLAASDTFPPSGTSTTKTTTSLGSGLSTSGIEEDVPQSENLFRGNSEFLLSQGPPLTIPDEDPRIHRNLTNNSLDDQQIAHMLTILDVQGLRWGA